MSKQHPSVAIIGVYPPPLGGISVHIQRLCHVLERRGIPFVVIDGSDTPPDVSDSNHPVIHVPTEDIERWCLRYVFRRNENIVFNHFLRWKVRFFLSLLKFKGVRVVHTVHSYRSEDRFSRIEKWMVKLTGRLSDHFIAVTEEVKERLVRVGIPAHKISVIPAFIPPAVTGEQPDIPDHVWAFFHRHKKVIVANGGIGNEFGGADLYGVDLCVDAFIHLAQKHPGSGFLFGITHIVNKDILNSYKSRLEEAGLSDRFCWVHEKMPLHPLLEKAALFVRPTASDGDALSIREALYYGTPVIASDVVKRPDGVITFTSRNLDHFVEKCDEVLALADGKKKELSEQNTPVHSEQGSYVEQVIEILLRRR